MTIKRFSARIKILTLFIGSSSINPQSAWSSGGGDWMEIDRDGTITAVVNIKQSTEGSTEGFTDHDRQAKPTTPLLDNTANASSNPSKIIANIPLSATQSNPTTTQQATSYVVNDIAKKNEVSSSIQIQNADGTPPQQTHSVKDAASIVTFQANYLIPFVVAGTALSLLLLIKKN